LVLIPQQLQPRNRYASC